MNPNDNPSEIHKQLLELQSNLVNAFDVDGVMLYINPAYAKVFGVRKEDIIGKKVFSFIPKINAKNLKKVIEIVSVPPYIHEHRTQIDTAIGENWYQWQHTGILDEDGKLQFIVGVGSEITSYVEAEEELIKSEERYRKIFQTSPLGIMTGNIKGYITSCNQTFANLSGYAVEDFIGKHYTEIPTIIPQSFNQYASLLSGIMKGTKIITVPANWKHKNGENRTGKASLIPLKRDGKIKEIQIIIEDITDSIETQKALEKSDAIISTTSDAIIATDTKGYITLWNQGAEDLFKYKKQEIIGTSIGSIVKKEDVDKLRERQAKLIQGIDFKGEKLVYIDKFGEEIEALASLTTLRDSKGNVTEFVGTIKDITELKKAEEQLKQSEEKFRKSFTNSMIPMSIVDQNGRYLSINTAACQIFGYSEDQFLNLDYIQITHPEDIERSKKRFSQGLEQGKAYDIEKRYTHKNGDTIIGLTSVSPIYDSNGEFLFAITQMQDITARKLAEKALIQERNKAQLYLDIAEIMILALDVNQKISLANRKCIEVLGYEHEAELLGKDWVQNFVPENDSKYVKDVFQKIYQGEIKLVEYVENPVLTKEGEERIIAWRNAVLENESGKIIGILSSGEDITEKKKAEQALTESEERFRLFSNLATEGIVIHEDGICIDCNLAMSKITGYDLEELIGMDLIQTLILPKYHELVFHSMNNNIQIPYEIEIKHKQGQIVPIKLQGDEMPWRGITRRIVNVQDITEQKLAENVILNLNKELEDRVNLRTAQLREANQELEAFSYSVSHDLKAPLRAILGFSQIIDEEFSEQLPEEVLFYFSHIQNSIGKMNQLIDGLLDLARLDRKTLSIESVDLDALAQSIFNELAAIEPGRQISFEASTGAIIQVDREMASILMTNLIGNAIKYTRLQPESKIHLFMQNSDNNPIFGISDNGIGFSMEYQDKLFKPFQRLHAEEIFEGTGIGLSLAKRIVNFHNGNIWVESEEGKGTTFYFTFGSPDLE